MDTTIQQFDCLQSYKTIRSSSIALIENLSAEDCSLQASDFVSPAKWHLAHTSWFFETFLLLPNVKTYQPFHKDFQVLFNSYYNGIGEQFSRPKRHLLSRPSLEQVLEYRAYIDANMAELIKNSSSDLKALIVLGLNHEQQHQELLLMDLKYCFFQNPLYPSYYPSHQVEVTSSTESNFSQDSHKHSYKIFPIQFVEFKEQLTSIGVNHNSNAQQADFNFDNETPAHQVYLQNYKLADRLVTNGEYLQFIEEGGYNDASIWLSDGWSWIQQRKKDNSENIDNASSPLYWIKQNDQWYEFSLHGLQPLDLYAPVRHVNFYESQAYAQWSDCRLATEAEWEHAVKNNNENGIKQTQNEAWQWTQSAYQPYPGFIKPDGAVGEYNGKFMCNQMVLKGGCIFTPENHTRTTYRNFFYPQDQWPMTGIRLAKN